MKRIIALIVIVSLCVIPALGEGIIDDPFSLWEGITWDSTLGEVTRDMSLDILERLSRREEFIDVVIQPTDQMNAFFADVMGEDALAHLDHVILNFEDTNEQLALVRLIIPVDNDGKDDLFESICDSISARYATSAYDKYDIFASWLFRDARTVLNVTTWPGAVYGYGDDVTDIELCYLNGDYYIGDDLEAMIADAEASST